MRIRFTTQQGNALLIALGTISVMGVALASYLTLTSSQNMATSRSQAWNLAIPIAEAGVEEALSQLYYYGRTDLTANGWVYSGSQFTKQRTLDTNYYVVQISSNTLNPVITSEGFVRVPMSTNYLSRKVQITTVSDGMFMRAMLAKGQIDIYGNNVRTDSFDSTDPAYNTNGRYDSTKSKDGGDVATNSGLVNSLNVGNANIKGKTATGPGGSISVGSNGAVGSTAWQNSGNNGIQPSWSRNDMNFSFPDVLPPFSGGAFMPGSGNYMGTNYTYLFTGGNYQISSLSMSGPSQALVTADTVLWVTGNFSLSGQSKITMASGVTLKIYVGTSTGSGTSASIGGNGFLNSGYAIDCLFYGLPSLTSLSYSGNASFTGAIYAPNAAFTLNGGGSTVYDFVGASVTSAVTMNGHFNFHYDEALGRLGPSRGYIITGWNEL